MSSISHFDLCKKTAEWVAKKAKIAVYDYQSYATDEFPDCLSFDGSHSTLYEIKISRSDFLSDKKKDCRKQYKALRTKQYYWETKTGQLLSYYEIKGLKVENIEAHPTWDTIDTMYVLRN